MPEITPYDSASNESNVNGKRPLECDNYFSDCEDHFSEDDVSEDDVSEDDVSEDDDVSDDDMQPEISHFSQEVFEEYLVDWIVGNNQPLSQVESESFKQLLSFLQPGLDVMSMSTLNCRILDRFHSKASEMIELFGNLDCKISFTTDCWTSPYNIAFLGITAHFIDQDWALQSVALDFLPLPGAHTGMNLHQAFQSVLVKYRLTEKVMGITLDNALYSDSFIAEMNLDSLFDSFHHVRCFAHVLNLGAEAALSVIADDLEKLRVGIKKILSGKQTFGSYLLGTYS